RRSAMEDSPMNTDVYVSIAPMAEPAVGCTAELERLGDEIAELSAHLARGPRRDRGPRGARAGDPATAGAGARARRALVLESSGADSRADAEHRRATARSGPGGDRRAR